METIVLSWFPQNARIPILNSGITVAVDLAEGIVSTIHTMHNDSCGINLPADLNGGVGMASDSKALNNLMKFINYV